MSAPTAAPISTRVVTEGSADATLSQARSENFPVASFLLPRASRRHLMAVYGFARLTDDVGDESSGDRLAQLDWIEAELGRAAEGRATHPIFRRLTPTLRALDLPLQPFRDLIDANRQDQAVTRYETFDDLIGYCQLSAVPVGRLVLACFGADSAERRELSDQVCIGLQIVEHLQDVREDAVAGRIYLPLTDLRRCGVAEEELVADHVTPPLQRLLAVEAARAGRLLDAGRRLARTLPLRERVAIAGFTAGGLAALDAVRSAGYDVLAGLRRPRPARMVVRLVDVLARAGSSSERRQ